MPHPRRSATRRIAVVGLTTALALAPLGASPASAATPIGLGTAASFAVLAASTVTNTGPTTLNGDLGVSPGTAITGFPPGLVNGTTHAANAAAAQAQQDLGTAYSSAGAQATDVTITSDLGGRVLAPGVYSGTTLSLTGQLTLDGQGDPSAVFLFRSDSTFIAASSSSMALINGASACNVFVRVGSSATLGTDAALVGTFLAQASITADTGATVAGRLLARTAAVTLANNRVAVPSCAAPIAPALPSSPSPSATPTSAPTPTGTPAASPGSTPSSAAPAASSSAAPPTTPVPTPRTAPTSSPTGVAAAPVAAPARPVATTDPLRPAGSPTVGQAAGNDSSIPTRGSGLSGSTTDVTGAAGGTAGGAAGQVTRVPTGGVQAGGGSTAGLQHVGLLTTGLALLLVATLGSWWRRRAPRAVQPR